MSHNGRAHLRRIVREAAPKNPALLPVHLSGCQKIASTFMVGRGTVRRWRDAGAPITMIGKRLTTEYNTLMAWLLKRA